MMDQGTRKFIALMTAIAGLAATGVATQRQWLDPATSAVLGTTFGWLLGALRAELFPAPKYGRRATDPHPPREDDVPPAPDLRKEFPPVGDK